MKELSIEEKAQRYDEAIKRGLDCIIQTQATEMVTRQDILDEIFPELKYIEDEKIRKDLKELVELCVRWDFITMGEATTMLNWIENKGDYSIIVRAIKKRKEILSREKNNSINYKDKLSLGGKIEMLEELLVFFNEMQDDQKDDDIITDSENNGDKDFEPKFHKGQWIVKENVGVYKVIEVCESWYDVVDDKDQHYSISFNNEYMFHLWTIKDAKDGDVLTTNGGVVIFEKIDGLNIKFHCYFHYIGFEPSPYIDSLQNQTAFRPATKEESEMLFKIMKEDGYEWSSEQRKLIKIKKTS